MSDRPKLWLSHPVSSDDVRDPEPGHLLDGQPPIQTSEAQWPRHERRLAAASNMSRVQARHQQQEKN